MVNLLFHSKNLANLFFVLEGDVTSPLKAAHCKPPPEMAQVNNRYSSHIDCIELNGATPKRYFYVLVPKICDYYFTWIEGLCRLLCGDYSRNMNAEATSGECSEELRAVLLETGGNVLLIM